MKIIHFTGSNYSEIVEIAADTFKNGGLVVYPTETVYGIGVIATDPAAVDKLFKYKARREGKPMSVAVSDFEMASKYVEVNSIAENLYSNFLPGPLTVVSAGKGKVVPGIESESGTLGIRIPDYPLVRSITEKLDLPIVATSAAVQYKKKPYSVQDIFDGISEKQKLLIDLVIDAGTLPKREPSTVVDTTLNQEVVLRQGALQLTDVAEYITDSPQVTQDVGFELLTKYLPYLKFKSVIFALQGDMGAGKTEMTKGIALALEISDSIQSPTFIIEREYVIPNSSNKGRQAKLIHIDTWRLFDQVELEDLQFYEHVSDGNVFVVEWADKFPKVIEGASIDAVIVWVKLSYGDSLTARKIAVSDYVNK